MNRIIEIISAKVAFVSASLADMVQRLNLIEHRLEKRPRPDH